MGRLPYPRPCVDDRLKHTTRPPVEKARPLMLELQPEGRASQVLRECRQGDTLLELFSGLTRACWYLQKACTLV